MKPRRPHIRWHGRDLSKREPRNKRSFMTELKANTKKKWLGLYTPVPWLKGMLAMEDPESAKLLGISAEEGQKLVDSNQADLTIRMDDEERTLCGQYNESTTCPPPENCC